MLGSLDCTDWAWFGCPIAHKAQYCRRDHGHDPFNLLEAVASNDLWIWHAFFGVSRSNNDINEWVPFVKSITNLADDDYKRLQYKTMHEAARKEVERAFDVLKKKWAILAGPARACIKEKLANIMYACIILHNMIIKDRKETISPKWYPEEEHQPDDLLRSDEQRYRVISLRLDGVVYFSPHNSPLTMVTSIPSLQTRARLGLMRVKFSPSVSE
nr:hypothetical protein [Tanacetum cinerariifolium]